MSPLLALPESNLELPVPLSSGYDLKQGSRDQVSSISSTIESPLHPLALVTPFDPGKFSVFVTEALETANRLGLVSKKTRRCSEVTEGFR